MNRRRISNKTTFQFREDDIVKENRRSLTRTSAQSRLTKYRPSYNTPAVVNLPMGPPPVNIVPRGGRNGGVKEKSGKTGDLTYDPDVEKIVELLNSGKFLSESLQITNTYVAGQKDGVREVKAVTVGGGNGNSLQSEKSENGLYDPFSNYHDNVNNGRPVGFLQDNKGENNNTDGDENKSHQDDDNNNTEENKARPDDDNNNKTWIAPLLYKSSSVPSSPAENKSSDVGNDCICERKVKLVLCSLCGESFTGRVRKKCQKHPHDLFLLDVDNCPQCKESNVFSLKEFELPAHQSLPVNSLIFSVKNK